MTKESVFNDNKKLDQLIKEKFAKDEKIEKLKEYSAQELYDIFKESKIYFNYLWKSVNIENMSNNEKKSRLIF